jgi:O-methyltransferase
MVRLHQRVADLTLVPKGQFVDNLVVARQARSVPGDLVECGTWRGGMSAAMAWALPNRRSILLDSFEGLPDAKEIDGPAAVHWSTVLRDHDNCTAEERWAHDAMHRVGQTDYELLAGWFDGTVPTYAARGRPIAVLRLDGDWYESTMVCLEHLFPLVSPNGVVIIDDYFDWDGCSRAVHDYLSRLGSADRLRTSAAQEFAYVVKSDSPA